MKNLKPLDTALFFQLINSRYENGPGMVLGIHGILGYNMIMDFELRGNTWFYDFLGTTKAAAGRSRLWKRLSTREKMIIPLIYEGLTYKQIAVKLFISEGTVRKQITILSIFPGHLLSAMLHEY